MNRFSEVDEFIDTNQNIRPEFSKGALNKFDEILDDVKRKIEGDKYGEMGKKCLLVINDMAEQFDTHNWEAYSPDKRAEVLDNLAKRIGKECGVEIKGVRFFGFPPYNRGYVNGDGYIYLHDSHIKDPKLKEDALGVVCHEARHVFQKTAVKNPNAFDVDEKTIAKWKDNFDNYLSAEKFGYYRYFTQPVEVDARAFSEYVVKKKEW